MNEHSLRVLEFGRVLALVGERAPSSLGRDRLARTPPAVSRRAALARQRETTQMRALRARGGGLPWAGSQDVTAHLERLRPENSRIEGPALVLVGDFAGACARVARAVGAAEGCPDLARHAAEIPDLGPLEREIRRCLTPEGEVRDDATPELLALRRGIAGTRRDVVAGLERVMGAATAAGALQDPIVTLRAERYVIPVKAGARGAVPGLVHDRSASGQTVFVEPQAVVELNNRLREQVAAEREETIRVLRLLSERVRRAAGELLVATAAMAELEAIWARAAYADERDAVEPRLFEEPGRIELRGARHPLLLESLGERAVPIELAVGGEVRTLVVTGPNTGGKTVVLKAAGLLALMAQSGLHLPAAPGTGLSVFADVLADIGDEQSIEQNLSTFSGHVANLVVILAAAGPGTLVLLDELGAGTDPSEGAALGVAVLEETQGRGALTLATTHHNAVKVYASGAAGVMNAAMEFDEATLRPTYRLLAGMPGRSQAFAIAERCGLDPGVIARARGHRTVGEERFDRLMEELERERSRAAAERAAAAAERDAAAIEHRRLAEEAAAERRRFEEARERLRRETRTALRAAEAEVKEALRELRVRRSEEGATRAKEASRRLAGLAAERLALPEGAAPAPPATVAAGERVFVNPLRSWGVVETAGEGTATVLVGDKRITVPLADLGAPEGAEAPPPRPGARVARRSGRGSYSYRVPEVASTRLDLRGRRAEEALAELDRFLDAAALSGVAEVEVLHGKGTGRLQEAVREALGADGRVAAFAYAPLEQGGTGITKVTLAR